MKNINDDLQLPITVGDNFYKIIREKFNEKDLTIYLNQKIQNLDYSQLEKNSKDVFLLLFFYPGDFTFVCPTELEELADKYEEFKKEGVDVYSVSTDSVYSHKVWHNTSPAIGKINFPMISDRTHFLSSLFGVLDENDCSSKRATILIDKTGKVIFIEIIDNSIGRNATETLRKIKAAKFVSKNKGMVCPASWIEGKDALSPSDDLVGKL